MLTDTDLLIRLCSENEPEDKESYEEFVKRFLPAVTIQCGKICCRWQLDEQIGKQIAHQCFEQVRKYKSFKQDEIKINNSQKAVLVYLYRIARNLFNDHYRTIKRKEAVTVNKNYFDDLFGNGISDPLKLQQCKANTLKIFSQLSTKEQRVLLTDLEFKTSQHYLPDEVNERLAAELGVKKPTIRKIRERVIKKLKTAIHEAEAN